MKEETHWNLMPSTAASGAHLFGELHGISGIRDSRQTELMPYLSFRSDHNNQNDNPYIDNLKLSPNAGVDAKMGIGSNFTLDATLNPDFGQVEGDPSELNLTAYETYYEEKRPFFLEGNDVFDYKIFTIDGNSNPLFYSRRIGAVPGYYPAIADTEKYRHPENTTILGSAKLSGRTQNGLSIGVLETVTQSEFGTLYRYDSASKSVDTRDVMTEPYTNYFASRVKKETADANTVMGASFNSVIRNLDGYALDEELVSSAHTAGLDFKHMILDKTYYFQSTAFGSYLTGSRPAILKRQESDLHEFQRPGASHLKLDSAATTLAGEGGSLEIGKQAGIVQFWINGSAWSPGVDFNDMGFLKDADRLYQEDAIYIVDNNPRAPFTYLRAGMGFNNGWTTGNEHVTSKLSSYVYGSLLNLWRFDIEGAQLFPSLDTRVLRGGPALYQDSRTESYGFLSTDQSKRLFGQIQSYYDFSLANTYIEKGYGLKLSANPIDKLSFSADFWYKVGDKPYEYVDAGRPLDSTVVGRQKQETISVVLRAGLYFSPKLSLQYYGTPLFSSVNYSDFRRVAHARAENQAERFQPLSGEIAYDQTANRYNVNEGGLIYSFANPDESYSAFQSNFVFRWEYKPGSLLYLVWSHQQGKDDFIDAPRLDNAALDVFQKPSRDVVMAKLSYWFNL